MAPPGLEIPNGLAEAIRRFGEEGARWLELLPDRLQDLERRWSVDIGPPFSHGGTASYVAPAELASGERAVMKVPIPHREAEGEPHALQFWAGRGAVRLLAVEEWGAMLLERCEPGAQLGLLEDPDEIVTTGARLLTRLHAPPAGDHRFELLENVMDEWAELMRRRFREFGRPFEASLMEQGAELLETLPRSASESLVLHGDYHHWNILSARREPWLVIDPKPMVGDPVYDSAQFLGNRFGAVNGDVRRFRREVDLFAEHTGFDRERVLLWTAARVTESALWNLSVDDPDESRIDAELARTAFRLSRTT